MAFPQEAGGSLANNWDDGGIGLDDGIHTGGITGIVPMMETLGHPNLPEICILGSKLKVTG